VACRKELMFPEDEMFTISDLYQNDTNGFVKVRKKIDYTKIDECIRVQSSLNMGLTNFCISFTY
jgi:hypothetical protein